ncbi:hypothetical protein D3C78_1434370 [compost metagenome]
MTQRLHRFCRDRIVKEFLGFIFRSRLKLRHSQQTPLKLIHCRPHILEALTELDEFRQRDVVLDHELTHVFNPPTVKCNLVDLEEIADRLHPAQHVQLADRTPRGCF